MNRLSIVCLIVSTDKRRPPERPHTSGSCRDEDTPTSFSSFWQSFNPSGAKYKYLHSVRSAEAQTDDRSHSSGEAVRTCLPSHRTASHRIEIGIKIRSNRICVIHPRSIHPAVRCIDCKHKYDIRDSILYEVLVHMLCKMTHLVKQTRPMGLDI